VDALTFQSNVLAVDQPVQRYLVYTPRCYRSHPERRYPVVYLLHGAQATESQWDDVGIVDSADRLIASGTIPEVVIVLPDGIWAMGTYDDDPPLFDRFLVGEVLPAVEQDYRTIGSPAARALGGISRGGEWALLTGGRHPELFGTVGAQSPALGPPGSPLDALVAEFRGRAAQRLWLDVGTRDSLLGTVTALHDAWARAGIAHEWHVEPGGHNNSYWASQVDTYLRFYAGGLPAPT
jgi:enterochelin esterase-like enzyme